MNGFSPSFVCRCVGAVLPLLLVACAGTPPARHYLLEATAVAGPVAEHPPRAAALIVEHVQLADYLNRLPIVRRSGDGRLVFNDGERWAEPLELAFRRVLADNLERGGNAVVPSPAPAATETVFRLRVEVSQFDIGADERAVLDARWSLRPANGKDGIVRHSRLLAPLAGRGRADSASAATVDALNRLLAAFAAEVHAAAWQLPRVCSARADCR